MMNLFLFLADHLIELMGGLLVGALAIRWFAWRETIEDRTYFNSFSQSVEKVLERRDRDDITDVDIWLNGLLDEVSSQLPDRRLRGRKETKDAGIPPGPAFRNSEAKAEPETLQEYAEGKKSILHAVKHQADAFKSAFPPNYTEITYRVLAEDRHWKQILGMPVEMLVRVMDILPGMFVIFGILGTFIGIASALPQIGAIDMNKIADSGPILNQFIEAVSLSMRASIAGIFCSIVMTLLNALYPIYAPRAEVRRNLERCFELMWLQVHGEKLSNADSRVIELLERIAVSLESPSRESGLKKAA